MSTINGVLVTRINPTNLYLEIEDKTRSSLPMTFVGAHTKSFHPTQKLLKTQNKNIEET